VRVHDIVAALLDLARDPRGQPHVEAWPAAEFDDDESVPAQLFAELAHEIEATDLNFDSRTAKVAGQVAHHDFRAADRKTMHEKENLQRPLLRPSSEKDSNFM
jgi:hypothetical protein